MIKQERSNTQAGATGVCRAKRPIGQTSFTFCAGKAAVSRLCRWPGQAPAYRAFSYLTVGWKWVREQSWPEGLGFISPPPDWLGRSGEEAKKLRIRKPRRDATVEGSLKARAVKRSGWLSELITDRWKALSSLINTLASAPVSEYAPLDIIEVALGGNLQDIQQGTIAGVPCINVDVTSGRCSGRMPEEDLTNQGSVRCG